VKLPEEVTSTTVWAHVNLNKSPDDKSLREAWMLQEVVAELRASQQDTDFDELETLLKLFAPEVNRLKKGALKLLEPASDAYNTRLSDAILSLQSNAVDYAKALCRFVCGDRGKLLVVVFDNCDKRDRDEQLAMFQAARWLQSQIKCLIILPIRDVTYEAYRDTPPLDTAIKDLIFRIEPPPFSAVLRKRIALVLAEVKTNSKERILEYTLPNGMRVEYPATDLGYYLATIFKSLYEHDKLLRSLLLGLAGRDLRKAMEIFLEFCRSGHIGTDEYLKIRTERGHWGLPYHVVTRVLLRRNRRYYDGTQSLVANLFQCDPTDARPDSFCRLAVLKWLEQRANDPGPTGVKGFHRAVSLVSALVPYGHDADRLTAEIGFLIKHGCIIAEHQQTELESVDDLIRIAPSGLVHLKMVTNPSYLAACAEDTWMTCATTVKHITDRIGQFGPKAHYSPITVFANSRDFVQYLMQRIGEDIATPAAVLYSAERAVPEMITEAAARSAGAYDKIRASGGWETLQERFVEGMECEGAVLEQREYGVFVKLDGGPRGLIHLSRYPSREFPNEAHAGRRALVVIARIHLEERKLALGFIRWLE
jgi:hypothetical protein